MWLVTVAWKNLFRRKVRSAATLFGTALSVTTLVALVGLADGFSRSFQEAFAQHSVDLVVTQGNANQRVVTVIDEDLGPRIAAIRGVARVVPVLFDKTSLEENSFIGVPLNGWTADSPFFSSLQFPEGRRLTPDDRRGVVL